MMITAVFYALLAGALGAGFGYLFSGLLQGILDLRERPYWFVLAAAGFAATVTFVVVWAPWRSVDDLQVAAPDATSLPAGASVVDTRHGAAAYLEGLKTEDPALYKKVQTSLETDKQAGVASPLALAHARDMLDDYIERKTPFLDDEIIVERFQLLSDILSYLGAHNDNEICADLALGTKRSGVQQYLAPELVARDSANVAHIVTAVRDEAAAKLAPDAFKNLTNAAFAHAAQNTGIALEEIDTLLTGTGDPKKTCMIMTGYFAALVSLSPSEAGPALRTMAAGEQSPVPQETSAPAQ